MIEARGIGRTFGGPTGVHTLDLSVSAGEIVGLLGRNGAGKTTALRLLAGVLDRDSGALRVAGHDPRVAPEPVRRAVGLLGAPPALYDELSVDEHVAHVATLHGRGRPAVARALAHAELDEVRHRRVGALSTGFRQRVGLACAWVHDPQVLLLDEPADGLDPAQRASLRAALRERADAGCAVILSTHVLGEVEALCDRVVVLDRGRQVAAVDVGSADLEATFLAVTR